MVSNYYCHIENIDLPQRWMRWLATGAGILGGVTCILSGVFMSITHLIDPKVPFYSKLSLSSNSTPGTYRMRHYVTARLFVVCLRGHFPLSRRQHRTASHSTHGYYQVLASGWHLLRVSFYNNCFLKVIFDLACQCFHSSYSPLPPQ